MNLTDELIFLVEGDALAEVINQALQDTCEVIHRRALPESNIKYFDASKISSNGRTTPPPLAFLKFFLHHSYTFNEQWVEKVFTIIFKNGNPYYYDQGNKILRDLAITTVIEPIATAYNTVRGLHIFLIALWARKAIQLPITFSLPQATIKPNKTHSKSYKLDTAYELYPPIMKIVRFPFQKKLDDPDTPNIYSHIPPSSMKNYKSLAWRPIIASSWETLRDIRLDDIQDLFRNVFERRKQNKRSYPLSAYAWISPLAKIAAQELSFSIDELRLLNKRRFPSSIVYDESLHADTFSVQRDSWRIWTDDYAQMKIDRNIVKDNKEDRSGLADLATYFLKTLPSYGIEPPAVEQVLRRHLDGYDVAPPYRQVAKNKKDISNSKKFFNYVSTTLATQGIKFNNPLTKYDMPRESRPSVTDKKTFTFNEFREFYALSYALLELINYILYTSLDGQSPYDWQKTLCTLSNKRPIIETEELGFVPLVTYMDIQGKYHVIPIRYLPYDLLALQYLPIRTNDGQKYLRLPTPDAIASIITALETSIRFIHIRWLDSLLLAKESPELRDDYLAIANKEPGQFFHLFVNTDKSGTPWTRPTSTRLLKVFSAVSRYKKQIARNHFENKMRYTHHDLTHYPMITALFCDNKNQTVLTELSYRRYYKSQLYFFNQLRHANDQPPLESLPQEIMNLETLNDFELAYSARAHFKSEYTPHGIRATVISLSSTFLTDEHIGREVSGHKTPSVARYVVVNKDLVADVGVLTGSKIISAFNWSKADVYPAPQNTHDLLHSTFAIQGPNGDMLSNEEILARSHQLTTFSTHFCLAGGNCTEEVVKTIGRWSCGQCYLGLKAPGHLPAILALIRRLASDLDNLKLRIKHMDKSVADGALKKMEVSLGSLINEVSAWILTAQHMMKNAAKLKNNFMKVSLSDEDIQLALLPSDGVITNLVTRMSDAISYPELANSSLKADVFKLSVKLMKLDTSFVELLSMGSDQQIIYEMKGRLESLLLANNFSTKHVENLLQLNITSLPPKVAAL